ncbi:DUF3568 family protein [Desulfocurvus sp. DL9XJH121]
MPVTRIKRALGVVLMLAALAGLSGCAVVAAGAMAGGGTYAYISGWGTKTYNVDISTAFNAARGACNSLGLSVTKTERHLSEAEIEAKDGDSSVWIDLKSKGVRVTEIAVRVGVLGDKVASERIHDHISQRLQ